MLEGMTAQRIPPQPVGPRLTGLRVAFFRNLNLGQRRSNSPTSAELLDAFAAVGASGAANVRTNGTVIFGHTGGQLMARQVVDLLTRVCGYHDVVCVRSARWVVDVARRLPEEFDGEVCLFDAPEPPPVAAPLEGPLGMEIVALSHRHAVVVYPPGRRDGGANPFVADLVGVPATSRGFSTFRLLSERLTRLS